MISRKYKIIYDLANCIMIYLLGLAIAIGAAAFMKRPNFPWAYAIASAIILAGCVAMRLFIQQLIVSAIGHIIIVAVVWFAFVSKAEDTFQGILILAFAILLSAIDLFADFYKKKNQSYGEIHVFACLVFLPVYAYVDWKQKNLATTDAKMSAVCGIYGTLICVVCIVFFGLTLVRAYMKNAIKLADNSQIDENAPVTYMYGNSNKFIGPIIAFIIAIMLVIQSKTSSNIFATIWMGLLQGVAGICNLFSFLSSSDETISSGTQVAPFGTTLFWVEVVISAIIVIAIIIAIAVIISKIYKSHWHKDVSLDETLESAAMVEKREWIYHKASKKVSDDTSVSKAKEIAVEKTEEIKEVVEEKAEEVAETTEEQAKKVSEAAEEQAEEVAEAVEEQAEEVEEVAEAVEDQVEEAVEEAAETVEEKAEEAAEVAEAVEEKTEEVAEAVEEKAEEAAEAVEEKAEETVEAVEEKTEEAVEKKPEVKKPSSNNKSKKRR